MNSHEVRSSGFSYNGIHCEDMGLTYVPDEKGRMEFAAPYKPITETVTGRMGGYWYGNQVSPLEFSLDCYYEDLKQADVEAIYQWLGRDTSGELVFDERPWCYYEVRPRAVISGKKYYAHVSDDGSSPVYSATLTIQFTAYEPFAKMKYASFSSGDTDPAEDGSGIVKTSQMPELSPAVGVQMNVYNPGTEPCYPTIVIGGTAGEDGITIRNLTTGEACSLTSLPQNGTLTIDSYSGKVFITGTSNLRYDYHNLGYITLAPCTPYRRNVEISYTANSNAITGEGFRASDVGKYAWFDGSWHKILNVASATSATVRTVPSNTGTENTILATMNEIIIEGDEASLTTFSMTYTPMVR